MAEASGIRVFPALSVGRSGYAFPLQSQDDTGDELALHVLHLDGEPALLSRNGVG